MTAEKSKKPFELDHGPTAFTMRDVENIRDQDNAQLVPKPPPAIFRLDRPNLAPPGMKGITRSVRTDRNVDININLNVRIDEPYRPKPSPVRDVSKERLQLGDQGNARRQFKPLAQRSLGADETRRTFKSIAPPSPSDKGSRDR